MNHYIGQLLDDRYEILEVIGTGGMAVVYKALDHRLNRPVAIKILKDEFSGDDEFRRRFRAEGEAVAMLSHPNIVQVYDVSSSDTANYLVMELINGISLKQYMEVKGVLNWKETLHFAMQIAKGLEHAHSRGIVHRDIKPHNVMVLKDGSVKVMDFGIARVMSKSNTLTKEALGSVHYISPEQAKGGYTDKDVEKNILSNPFKRFADMRFFQRCKDVTMVRFNPWIYKKLDAEDFKRIHRICDKKLEEYYARFK